MLQQLHNQAGSKKNRCRGSGTRSHQGTNVTMEEQVNMAALSSVLRQALPAFLQVSHNYPYGIELA